MIDRESWVGVHPGDVLVGRYRVERIVSAGGLGVVAAASDLEKNAKVALKFLLPDSLSEPDAGPRFLREALAATRIESEHVARVLDVGTLPESGLPFMVMEYLEGGDLAAWLRERGPLTIELAVDFVLQTCIALADALGHGIVHRHLKPANLFCVRRPDGRLLIKVLDFGISASSQRTSSSTREARAPESASFYLAPEQVLSAPDVDARTDIWSLGVVFWALVTGRPPFAAPTRTELAAKVTSESAGSLRALRPDVPAGLDAIVATCLRKNREQRYASVAELATALLPYAAERAKPLVGRVLEAARTPAVTRSGASSEPTTDASSIARPKRPGAEPMGRRAQALAVRRRRWTLAAVLFLGTAGVIAFAATARLGCG